MPVVSTSFSLVDSSQSLHRDIEIAPKHEEQNSTEASSSLDYSSKSRDEDELFLLSLLPSMKRLTIKKKEQRYA